MGRYVRFDVEDRQELLVLLETFHQVAARHENLDRLLGRLATVMQTICGDAELEISEWCVAFTASDHRRYYANGSGLWFQDGDSGGVVLAHKWWMAALETRVYWMRLMRRAPEVAWRSRRFELKGV